MAGIGIDAYLLSQLCPATGDAGQAALARNDVSLDDVYRDLTDLDLLLGAPDRVAASVARMRATADDAARRLQRATTRPRVAMVTGPVTAADLRDRLGAACRFDDAWPLIEQLRADPALARVPAVCDGRLVAVTFAEVSPGVRNADGAANLARVLRPERFH